MQFNSLEAAWKNIEETVLPATVGWAERKNLKNCFYNGAHVMWNMIGMLHALPDDESQFICHRLHTEMLDHIENEKAGRY